MKEVISAEQAARELGVPAQAVRERIKQGVWNFGDVVKGKNGKDTYLIYRGRMNKFLGRES